MSEDDLRQTMEQVAHATLAEVARFAGPAEVTERDTVSAGTRLRCFWRVEVGIIPGQPLPEYTRRWMLTSESWERERNMSGEQFQREFPDGRSTFRRYFDEATEYSKQMADPRAANWVRVDWIWL